MLFRDVSGQWMSTFFGNGGGAVFTERAGILPIEFDAQGKIKPLMWTSSSPQSP